MKIYETIISLAPAIIISSIGWLANYIYKTSKWEKFQLIKLVANIFLAWFLGYIVQAFIPADSQMQWPLLAISWFCAYPILQLLETNGTNLISKFLK